jgi:hypothetical protein
MTRVWSGVGRFFINRHCIDSISMRHAPRGILTLANRAMSPRRAALKEAHITRCSTAATKSCIAAWAS